MKLVLRIVGGIVVVVLVLVAGGLAWLAYPGEPGPSHALRFERYVLLPRHGFLNVLDYMNVEGRTLYVGGTSAGSVIRVDLAPANPKVSEWQGGQGRVHGIAIAGDLGFATRSESNTVDVFSPSRLTRVASIAVPD